MIKSTHILIFCLAVSLFVCSSAVGEQERAKKDIPTIEIIGRVRNPVTISMEEIMNMEPVMEKERIMYGKHAKYMGAYDFKGVYFKALFEKFAGGINARKLDAIVFIFEGSDGFYAPFTYGELYNSYVDAGLIIAYERDGKQLDEKVGPFWLINKTDKYAGRAVKRLRRITVKYAGADLDDEKNWTR